MTGHRTRITSHTIDKSGKLKPKKPRSVSQQVAIAKSKTKKVVSRKRGVSVRSTI